ncbi:hypothetical protein Hanom_Chr17g01553771 [Helianthus anomalus]
MGCSYDWPWLYKAPLVIESAHCFSSWFYCGLFVNMLPGSSCDDDILSWPAFAKDFFGASVLMFLCFASLNACNGRVINFLETWQPVAAELVIWLVLRTHGERQVC